MIKKRILNPGRVRQITGGFSYIPHRFLTGGFLASLEQKEILLYLFLILVYGGDIYMIAVECHDIVDGFSCQDIVDTHMFNVTRN